MAKLKHRQPKNTDIFNGSLGIIDENSVNLANMIEEEKPDLVFSTNWLFMLSLRC